MQQLKTMAINVITNEDGAYIKISDLLCWLTNAKLTLKKEQIDEHQIVIAFIDNMYDIFNESRESLE